MLVLSGKRKRTAFQLRTYCIDYKAIAALRGAPSALAFPIRRMFFGTVLVRNHHSQFILNPLHLLPLLSKTGSRHRREQTEWPGGELWWLTFVRFSRLYR